MNIDSGLLAVIASVSIIVLAALWSVIGWATRHSWRAVLRGAGVCLSVLGLWVAGVMNLTANGIQSLISWFEAQRPFNIVMFIAMTIAGIGIALVVISTFIAPVTRERNKERKTLEKEREAAALANLNASKARAVQPPAASNLGATPPAPVAPINYGTSAQYEASPDYGATSDQSNLTI